MITTTEFFMFIIWAVTLAYAAYERSESRKAKIILMELLEDDAMRERIVQDFQLFKKSIIK